LMGSYRNGWKSNLVMGLMLVVSLYLIGRSLLDL
jgi:hypothetical protein